MLVHTVISSLLSKCGCHQSDQGKPKGDKYWDTGECIVAIQFVNQQDLRKEKQLRFFDVASENGRYVKPEHPSLIRFHKAESQLHRRPQKLSTPGDTKSIHLESFQCRDCYGKLLLVLVLRGQELRYENTTSNLLFLEDKLIHTDT